MTQLPAGWAEATLSDVAELVRGVTYKKSESRGLPGAGLVPIVRATNIDGRLRTDTGLVYVPESAVNPSQRLRVGDVVVASSSGSASVVGKSAIVRTEWDGAFGAFCTVLRARPGIDASYLGHYVASPSIRQRWSDLASGTSINNLKREHFQETAIPIPSLTEQRRIVAAVEEQLSRLEGAAASLVGIERSLRVLRTAILLDTLEGDWPLVEVGAVASVDSGPAFQSRFFGGPGDGVRLLRGENIEPGRLRWRETRTWPKPMLESYEQLLVQSGDVILAMDRPVISSGLKLARVEESDIPALLVQRVARIRAHDRIRSDFLFRTLQLPRFVPHVVGDQTGTQLPHITLAGIRAFEIPLPPREVQEELVNRLELQLAALDRQELVVGIAKKRIEKLRRSILATAFRGELVPQDPDDEQASVLLERIAAERAAAPKPVRKRREKASA